MLFKVFILAIGILAASAGSAHAEAANGTFSLAHEARWEPWFCLRRVHVFFAVSGYAGKNRCPPNQRFLGGNGLAARSLGGKAHGPQQTSSWSQRKGRIVRERVVPGRYWFGLALYATEDQNVRSGNGQTGPDHGVSTGRVRLHTEADITLEPLPLLNDHCHSKGRPFIMRLRQLWGHRLRPHSINADPPPTAKPFARFPAPEYVLHHILLSD